MGKPKRKLTKYNKCMSRELKGKLSGKTKAQRAALFKAAAKRCSGKTRSASSKPKSRASPKKRSNPTGGTTQMTKNSFNMNKIYSLSRKVALAAPLIGRAIGPGTPASKIDGIVADYTGWAMGQQNFDWRRLQRGWIPFIAVSGVTRGVIPFINKIVRWLG